MKYVVLIIIMFFSVNSTEIHAQRGCCSHHGGVAGCSSNGRQICSDGTLSPSCTCTPVVQTIYGCTDPEAKNYNKDANKDNGSCEYYVYGCTDSEAKNYNVNADKDDNSCIYKEETIIVNAEKDIKITETENENYAANAFWGFGIGALAVYLYKRKKNKK